jgi:hypothetical protein
MANGNTQLYASQGNGGRATVTVNELAALIGGEISIPPAQVATLGGVLLGAGVTPASATVPAAAPAGGTGTAAGAWDTSANRDAAIATINGLRTDVIELQTKVNALISSLSASGSIAGG